MNRCILFLAGILLGFVRLAAAETISMKSELLDRYVQISQALAADDLKAAKTAAAELVHYAAGSDQKDLAAKTAPLARAATIEAARGAFKDLSAAVEPLAVGRKDYVVMHCPMADSDWVQMKGKTQNPYFGKAMLTCGSLKTAP